LKRSEGRRLLTNGEGVRRRRRRRRRALRTTV